jgi:tetratricopeptide (TPR) repeat protein
MEHDGGHVLLQNKLSDTTEQERSELLQRLGGLALAIDQAAAYISFHKLSIPDFMAAYESRKVKILQYYEKTDWEYNKHFNDSEKQIALTAYTTWEMSFQQVEPANPVRKEWITRFLSISAFLHPARIGEHIFREHYDNTYSPESDWLELFTSIPNNGDADEIGYQNSLRDAQKTKSKWLRFLRRKIVRSPKRTSSIIPGKKWESCQFQEVTRNLEKLSLVNNTDNCSGDTGLWFSIHPVIRDWLQIRMKSNLRQETLEESFRLIETVVALEVTKVAGADVNQELLNHVDILVDPLKALCKCGFLDDVFLGDSAIKFGRFYLDNGHHMKAIELLEYALDVVRASSAADKLVFRLEYTLAVVYNRDLHSSKAIELLEHVVRVQDLEETHHLRLASQHELAIAYRRTGQVENAIKLLKHVVETRANLAENHPDLLGPQHELAIAYRRNGQVEDAIKLLEHVVNIQETSLTENHPNRLASQHSLALAYQDNGQVKDTIKLLEHVVQVCKGINEDHPNCLAAQHNLAITYIRNGQADRGIELLELVVQVWQDINEDHPLSLATRHDLAVAYIEDEQAGRGIELLEHVLQVQERTKTAENDPWYHWSRYELAEACQERDRNTPATVWNASVDLDTAAMSPHTTGRQWLSSTL